MRIPPSGQLWNECKFALLQRKFALPQRKFAAPQGKFALPQGKFAGREGEMTWALLPEGNRAHALGGYASLTAAARPR